MLQTLLFLTSETRLVLWTKSVYNFEHHITRLAKYSTKIRLLNIYCVHVPKNNKVNGNALLLHVLTVIVSQCQSDFAVVNIGKASFVLAASCVKLYVQFISDIHSLFFICLKVV